MDLGFTPEHRLLTPAQFKRVFDGATCKASGPSLLLLARENSLGHARLGLVIAKKNIRFAVQRNRIKRIVRESFRHLPRQNQGIDAIVLARRGLDEMDNSALRTMIDKQWLKIQKKEQSYQR